MPSKARASPSFLLLRMTCNKGLGMSSAFFRSGLTGQNRENPTGGGGVDDFISWVAAGVQAGYNVRWPSGLLLGFEADLTFPNYLTSNSIISRLATAGSDVTNQLDYVGTARGRIGYANGHWLVYATGGLAYAGERFLSS